MSALKAHLQDSILYVQHCHPEAGNSFGLDEALALTKIISHYRSQASALLWTSTHPTLFCGGGDLKAHFKLKDKKTGLAQARKITAAMTALAVWPIPKLAFVQGDCFGGGLELLSCFDHRICTGNVLFGFWQRRIGLSPGWGGYDRWIKKISSGALKNLAFTARVFGAAEAHRIGIINEIGSQEQAKRWLKQSTKWSPSSAQALTNLTEKTERKEFEKLWWTPTHQAALKKFNKR